MTRNRVKGVGAIMSAFNLFQKKKEILSQQVPENVQMTKPETASQSYQQGWLLYAAGKYEAAIEYYQQALRENTPWDWL